MSLTLNRIFVIVVIIHLLMLKLVWVGFAIPHTPSKAQFSYTTSTHVDEGNVDVPAADTSRMIDELLPKNTSDDFKIPLEFLIKKK